jgi:hypothetical protein
MRKIFIYLKQYSKEADKKIFLLSTLFIAVAIFINYYHGLNKSIVTLPEYQRFLTWYFIFLIAFSFSYVLLLLFKKRNVFSNIKFVALLLIAPSIFAWKMAYNVHIFFTADKSLNAYWNYVVYWPLKLLVATTALLIIWRLFDKEQPFYGLTIKKFDPKPYLLMLLIMVPLIAAASTQKDFLAMYPKMKNIIDVLPEQNAGLHKLLYELSYGSDFFTIELFFRGFLVLAFAKFAGKDAILPMACFYCTIHFGKPLGECISSYFGGLILGIVIYHTRTIYGGLIVHLGIAWLMELGGYLGNTTSP